MSLETHCPASTRGSRQLLALLAVAALSVSSAASAQQTVVVQATAPARSDSGGGYAGPNWWLMSSGLTVFGLSYMASVIVAGTSSRDSDKSLYVPLAGPWMAMANCCEGDRGRSTLLAFDGIFQGVGAIAIVSSFFMPTGRPTTQAAKALTIRVAPTSYGVGAPGLTVVGAF